MERREGRIVGLFCADSVGLAVVPELIHVGWFWV